MCSWSAWAPSPTAPSPSSVGVCWLVKLPSDPPPARPSSRSEPEPLSQILGAPPEATIARGAHQRRSFDVALHLHGYARRLGLKVLNGRADRLGCFVDRHAHVHPHLAVGGAGLIIDLGAVDRAHVDRHPALRVVEVVEPLHEL